MAFEKKRKLFDTEGKVYVGIVALGALLACISFIAPPLWVAGFFYTGMIVGVVGLALLTGKYLDMCENL